MRNLHLGTIGWSYSFWKGKFYPNKTASKDFLSYYATKYDTVEVDSTFYRIPTEQAITNWKKQTPENFRFSLKFPSVITHIKMLKDCERETTFFLNEQSCLAKSLGLCFCSFRLILELERLPDLADFLHKLPKHHRYVVEVRDEGFLNQEFYSLLKANNIALAWVDSPICLKSVR